MDTFVITSTRYKTKANKLYDPEKKCHVCDKTFKKTYSLSRHMNLHTGSRPFKCLECSFAFIQKSDLKRHIATHSDLKSYQCILNQCYKKFRTKRNLHSHQTNTHLNQGIFQCNVCKKQFNFYNSLRLHKKKVHGNKNIPFTCDFCGKQFTIRQRLRAHVMMHCKSQGNRNRLLRLSESSNNETNRNSGMDEFFNVKLEAEEQSTCKIEIFTHRVKKEQDEDRMFLQTFIPLMSKMNWIDRNKFKRKVEQIIEKVLKS